MENYGIDNYIVKIYYLCTVSSTRQLLYVISTTTAAACLQSSAWDNTN